MNIFVLDNDPRQSAKMHCDKHVVKMHVECVQMLVSALDRYGIDHGVTTKNGFVHKGGYANHPCTRWTGDAFGNFCWTYYYGYWLAVEHHYRYGKEPYSAVQMRQVAKHLHRMHKAMIEQGAYATWSTPFALAMPDEYKTDDAVESYRSYYIHEKQAIAQWKKGRSQPSWFAANTIEA